MRSPLLLWSLHPSAVRALLGVDRTVLGNWRRLEIFAGGKIPEGQSPVGGRYYSLLELVQIRVIRDLARIMRLEFASAIALSAPALARIRKVGPPERDEDGVFVAERRPMPPLQDQAFLLAWADAAKDKFSVRSVTTQQLMLNMVTVPYAVVVPIDALAISTIDEAMLYLTDENRTDDDGE